MKTKELEDMANTCLWVTNGQVKQTYIDSLGSK